MWFSCRFPVLAAGLLALTLYFPLLAQAAFWQDSITREDWVVHGQGRDLIRLDAIRELLNQFEEQPGYRLTVRHPGGDEGFEWGEQLRDWLVALGIPSSYIMTAPGSGAQDILHLSMNIPD